MFENILPQKSAKPRASSLRVEFIGRRDCLLQVFFSLSDRWYRQINKGKKCRTLRANMRQYGFLDASAERFRAGLVVRAWLWTSC